MQILYSVGQLMEWGGYLHLADRAGHWCVVGPGFLCVVADMGEGTSVMAKLKAVGKERGVVIMYQQVAEEGGAAMTCDTALA